MGVPCSCGCGTTVDVADFGLEVTVPAAARAKALRGLTDSTLLTVRLDANAEERLITLLKERFRERV